MRAPTSHRAPILTPYAVFFALTWASLAFSTHLRIWEILTALALQIMVGAALVVVPRLHEDRWLVASAMVGFLGRSRCCATA